MEEDVGGIFYNGRILNLKDVKISELEKIKKDLKNKQNIEKNKINNCLNKMKNN